MKPVLRRPVESAIFLPVTLAVFEREVVEVGYHPAAPLRDEMATFDKSSESKPNRPFGHAEMVREGALRHPRPTTMFSIIEVLG
jgi:hypothetical protein